MLELRPNLKRTSKLSTQGLLLMAVFLVSELAYTGGIYTLLQDAEKESRKEEHAKSVVAKATRLVKVIYDAGDCAEQYGLTQTPSYKARYQNAKKEALEIIPWLQNNISDPIEAQSLARLSHTVDAMTSLMDHVVVLIDRGKTLSAIAFARQKQMELQPYIKSLIPDMEALLDTEKKIEADSPLLQRETRKRTRDYLLLGLALNTIFAFTFALFFFRKISSKLDVLVDNVKRLGSGTALNAKLDGNDEITLLDSTFHEITSALKEEQEQLKESEERVRRLIERMPIGLFLLDEKNRIEFANPLSIKMFGYPEGRLLNKPLEELFKTEDEVEEVLSNGMRRVIELTAKTSSERTFPVEFSVSKMQMARGDKKLVVILDITERHQIQKLRQAFVATVSHELRTPLTSIRSYLTLLTVGALGELSTDVVKGAERAENNTVRLIGLVNDLLNLEKMESGNLIIELQQAQLSSIIEDSVSSVHGFAEEHGVGVESSDWKELTLTVDPKRIVQVLVNLLSNAIKFSERGSTVSLSVRKGGSSIEFSVRDTGRGIPESHQSLVFERFQQVDAKDESVKGGSGLGLAICKAIVEQHGGTIGINSELGKGSTFWFRLPLTDIVPD